MLPLKKNPVPKNGFEIFRHEVWLLAELTGSSQDQTVRQALSVLDEILVQKIAGTIVRKAIKNHNSAPLKFRQIFWAKYLETYDIEYICDWNGTDMKVAASAMKKIEDNGMSIEEYVFWLFDDFFPKNVGKISANHKIAMSTNVNQQYMTANAEKMKEKYDTKSAEMYKEVVINDARATFRETKNMSAMSALRDFNEGRLTLDGLAAIIDKIKKEFAAIPKTS
jgi:hypothetical protein